VAPPSKVYGSVVVRGRGAGYFDVMALVVVGTLADFPEGRGAPVRVGNRRLAVFRVGGELWAIADACPHRGFPLHDAVLTGGVVRCRTHGACFELASGRVVRGPATRGVAVCAVRVVGDEVFVEVPD
jgi:nitrite reductase/ring-hydroxylating ferredoxin subunit